MATEIWLAVFSVLAGIIGALCMAGYKDIGRRMRETDEEIRRLAQQDSKLNAAILTLLVAKADDAEAVAHALHGLLINGIERT
jgi:hypothetical protein